MVVNTTRTLHLNTWFKKGEIEYTKINFFHGPLREQMDFINSVKEINEIVDYFIEKEGLEKNLNMIIYPYSFFYVFFEQYSTIKGLTIQNYVLSLIVLFSLVAVG